MKKITGENCIELMKERFPKFLPYWESHVSYWGEDLGLTMQMLPFGKYAIDVIKSNDEIEIKKIFDFVEFLFCNGNDLVQGAIATGFLEYLLNQDPGKINFGKFSKYIGVNAVSYCKSRDEFTGVRTEGLW